MRAIAEDPIWTTIREETAREAQREPVLASFLYEVVLNNSTFEDAISFLLATKLESTTLSAISLRDLIKEAFRNDPAIGDAMREDIGAVCQRDPACAGFHNILLFYKGYHALQSYRAAHYFWEQGRKSLARFLQSRMSEAFGVDIHPAARIGKGILIDHATCVVIGETAVVGDNVSMLHEVTLGGTGKTKGDRHPKIGNGVLISAGAKILGNVRVGDGAKIGSGAVVLIDVPAHKTAVGVPAKIIEGTLHEVPALEMDHTLSAGGGI